jgi:hypothetical protein
MKSQNMENSIFIAMSFMRREEEREFVMLALKSTGLVNKAKVCLLRCMRRKEGTFGRQKAVYSLISTKCTKKHIKNK